MQIRRYADADFAAVVALWDDAGISVPYNDPALEIPLALASPNTALFVGERDGKLVGTLLAGHDGHRGWLYKLAVSPAHRHQGLGRQLVAHAEAWLAAQGMPKINLMIRDTNAAVLDFYVRLSYAVAPRIVMQKGLDAAHANPAGRSLDITVTHLEMTARPIRASRPHPPGRHALMRAEAPPIAFYRFLYEAVGARWFWFERRRMSDEALGVIIADPKVEIYVLHVEGAPAGFIELDRRPASDIDIALFGIMPAFMGRGFGAYLLDWGVSQAWSYEPGRLTVRTCTLDHPRALQTYQRAGFVPVRQEPRTIDDPRSFGFIPAHFKPGRP
jgi:ribosomal protein S18 acetylase RimI-like enzyme